MSKVWWKLLKSNALDFIKRWNEARVPILSASLAYFATFSLFPLLLLAVAGFGFALSQFPNLRDDVLQFMQRLIEQAFPSAADLLNANLETFKNTALERLAQNAGMSSLIAMVGLFWSASGFFAVLQMALTLAIPGTRNRGIVMQRVVAFVSLFTLAPLMLFWMSLGSLVSSLSSVEFLAPLQAYSSSVLALLGAYLLFSLSYRFLPAHNPGWRASLLGALPTALIWQAARLGLGLLTPTSSYQATYGILAGFLLLLAWLYLTMQIFLAGGVLVSMVEEAL
ncbi:MAG: YihY/virulence factor BrkB family protein [Deinococcales bacterium]